MDWVPVGRVSKTHGLKGELKFAPYVSDPGILEDLDRVAVHKDGEKMGEWRVKYIRGASHRPIMKLEGVDTLEAAALLSGGELFAWRRDLRPLPDGEYYWFEIEGLQVYDEEGRYHGRVEEIWATGSADVYVVRDGSKELLLPMIDSVVKTIDVRERKLIFHAVEGLLEDTSV